MVTLPNWFRGLSTPHRERMFTLYIQAKGIDCPLKWNSLSFDQQVKLENKFNELVHTYSA